LVFNIVLIIIHLVLKSVLSLNVFNFFHHIVENATMKHLNLLLTFSFGFY